MEDKDMKRRNLLKNICIMLVAMLGLSSCGMVIGWEEDMDVHQSIKFAGQWTGDFGMYYTYRMGGRLYTFDSYDTDIVFYPEYDGATWGYGKQVDYYEHGPYTHIYNRFDWEIRSGVIYLQYYSDPSLDCAIYDYSMTHDRFQGRFGNSNDRFYLTKIADYYDWSIYRDYYYYYPNGGWYWAPVNGLAEPDEPKRINMETENGKARVKNGDVNTLSKSNEENGIVCFGKRIE
jgi:hypothetical protein